MAENKTESKKAARKPKVQIGCQGWNYADWTTKAAGERVFYPRGTKSGEMLEIYARAFETIEVDSTFYAIPPGSAVENWFKKTPGDFTFALKMPREITHDRSLSEKSFPALEEFCERVSLLEKKLAAVLIQMPPQFDGTKENARNLRNFLARLPEEIRFAVEFRNREWLIDWTFEELEKTSVALCLVEGGWIPREMMLDAIGKLKTDFAYIRFMGERDLTTFDRIVRPQDAALQIWREEIGKIKAKDIYIYFSNFYEGFAPESVNKFREMFGQKTVEIEELENQGSLF